MRHRTTGDRASSSTVLSCDRILVLEHGRIVEQGTTPRCRRQRLYARLARLQFEARSRSSEPKRLPLCNAALICRTEQTGDVMPYRRAVCADAPLSRNFPESIILRFSPCWFTTPMCRTDHQRVTGI